MLIYQEWGLQGLCTALASSLEQRKRPRRAVSSQHPQQGSRLRLWGASQRCPRSCPRWGLPIPFPTAPSDGFPQQLSFSQHSIRALKPRKPLFVGGSPTLCFFPSWRPKSKDVAVPSSCQRSKAAFPRPYKQQPSAQSNDTMCPSAPRNKTPAASRRGVSGAWLCRRKGRQEK